MYMWLLLLTYIIDLSTDDLWISHKSFQTKEPGWLQGEEFDGTYFFTFSFPVVYMTVTNCEKVYKVSKDHFSVFSTAFSPCIELPNRLLSEY